MSKRIKDQIKKRLKHYWHEVFDMLATPAAAEFSMTCKHVVEQIDLEDSKKTLVERFRMLLHLSLCEACSYYLRATLALRRLVQEMAKDMDQDSSESADHLGQLNKDLLQKYARGPGSK